MAHQNIRVMCPNLTCRKVLAVPVSARGRTVRCRSCGTNIRIPEKKDVRQTPPAEEAAPPKDEVISEN